MIRFDKKKFARNRRREEQATEFASEVRRLIEQRDGDELSRLAGHAKLKWQKMLMRAFGVIPG